LDGVIRPHRITGRTDAETICPSTCLGQISFKECYETDRPLFTTGGCCPDTALSQNANPFAGRWDLTLTADGISSELAGSHRKGRQMEAPRAAADGNVARWRCKMDGGKLIVSVVAAAPARLAQDNRPAVPARPELVWELTKKAAN